MKSNDIQKDFLNHCVYLAALMTPENKDLLWYQQSTIPQAVSSTDRQESVKKKRMMKRLDWIMSHI